MCYFNEYRIRLHRETHMLLHRLEYPQIKLIQTGVLTADFKAYNLFVFTRQF